MARKISEEAADKAFAFAALEGIRSGKFDLILPMMLIAIRRRMVEITQAAGADNDDNSSR